MLSTQADWISYNRDSELLKVIGQDKDAKIPEPAVTSAIPKTFIKLIDSPRTRRPIIVAILLVK